MKFENTGDRLLRLLEKAHGPTPEHMPQFVEWAKRLCTPKVGPWGDLQRDRLYLDLMSVSPAQNLWMSHLVYAKYDEVEGQLLALFPNRASLACGVSFSHEHLQQAVVTLVVLHCRLELFGETAEAAEAA